MTRRLATRARVGLVVLALGLIGAACSQSSEPTGDVARGRASGDALKIVAEDSDFQPAALEAEAGKKVTVEVTNNDDTAHDFEIESLQLNTGTIEAGEVATATFTMPDETVEFVCTYHGGMEGRIVAR